MQVPQPSRTILDVRLQVKQRVPILRMARPRQFQQPHHHRPMIPLQQLRHTLPRQLAVKRRIPRHHPVIHQREHPLRVLRIESFTLRQLPRHRRDPHPAIPHLLIHPPNRVLDILLRQLPIQQKKQIHIRIRKQLPPSIPTHRHQRNPGTQARITLHRLPPQLFHQLVDSRCPRSNRHRTRRAARLKRTPNLQHSSLVLPAHPAADGVVCLAWPFCSPASCFGI